MIRLTLLLIKMRRVSDVEEPPQQYASIKRHGRAPFVGDYTIHLSVSV